MAKRIEWTAEMLDCLERRYPTDSASDIADALGCSTSTVVNKARKLGIRKSQDFRRSDFIGRYVRHGRPRAGRNADEKKKERNRHMNIFPDIEITNQQALSVLLALSVASAATFICGFVLQKWAEGRSRYGLAVAACWMQIVSLVAFIVCTMLADAFK